MGHAEPLPPAEPQARACHALVELAAIFQPEVNLAWLPRDPNPAIAAYFDNPQVLQALGSGLRLRLMRGEALDADRLPYAPGRHAVLREMDSLVELLTDLLDCDQIGLRLEVLQRAMCPRFHVDRVGIRLLCSYRGAGTEYLPGQAADRRLLGRADLRSDEEAGLILNPAECLSLPAFAIALVKGEAWPGNTGRGAIHRSPAVHPGHAPRVLLALDGVWS